MVRRDRPGSSPGLLVAARSGEGQLVDRAAGGARRHSGSAQAADGPIEHIRLGRTAGEFIDALTVAGMAAGLRERVEDADRRRPS